MAPVRVLQAVWVSSGCSLPWVSGLVTREGPHSWSPGSADAQATLTLTVTDMQGLAGIGPTCPGLRGTGKAHGTSVMAVHSLVLFLGGSGEQGDTRQVQQVGGEPVGSLKSVLVYRELS